VRKNSFLADELIQSDCWLRFSFNPLILYTMSRPLFLVVFSSTSSLSGLLLLYLLR
jgi:hypothetical protein